jgi:hypothetical protein
VRTYLEKNLITKKCWCGGVAQSVAPELKPQYCKKKKKKKKIRGKSRRKEIKLLTFSFFCKRK